MSIKVSQKIAVLRDALRMTQKDLADKLQLSRTLVAAWEADRSSPNDKQLTVLAKIFGISYESLKSPNDVIPTQYNLSELVETIIDQGEAVCKELSEDLRKGAFNPIVQEVMEITRREQISHETYHWRHPLDQLAHEQFLNLIQENVLRFFPSGLVVFSEESINEQGIMEPIVFPDGQLDNEAEIREYVIIDPLDRTAEAVRGIAGFASLTIGSFIYGPLVSFVFTLFDRYVSCYYAITGQGAWVKFRDGTSQPISPAPTIDLQGASLAAYVGRPVRLTRLATQNYLLNRHELESSFINVSGCYGFCLVASSQVDAFIEIAKGYAWHDIVSGAHILREAGGVVKCPNFSNLVDPFDPKVSKINSVSTREDLSKLAKVWSLPKATSSNPKSQDFRLRRHSFIAAGTYDLAAQIAIELAKTNTYAPL